MRSAKEGLLENSGLPSRSSVSILKNWAHVTRFSLEKRELLMILLLTCMSLLESKAVRSDLETGSALLKRSPMTRLILLLRSDIFESIMQSNLYSLSATATHKTHSTGYLV